MKFLFALSMAVFVLFCHAQAPYQWKTKNANGYNYKYVTDDPMRARFYTLSNGLTVILSVNHAEPRISARISVRTGSNNDPRDHTGLAHYLEHVLFKGTQQYGSLNWPVEKNYLDSIDNLYEQYGLTTDSARRKAIYHQIDQTSYRASQFAIANEYDKMMADIGSQSSNAHTWVEETVYEEDFPANATDKFLVIQAERFRDPVFRLFHTELEAVYEEKNRGLDNDNAKIYEQMNKSLFPTHNYGQQSTIGTIESLRNPSLKEIKAYYNAYYVPNNMAIILAGDFDADSMIRKVDHAFGYMQEKKITPYSPSPEKPLDSIIFKKIYGPTEESLEVGFRTPAAGTRDALVMDLISSILYNGKAGLMDLDLNKQQKVQTSTCGILQFKDYGELLFDGSPKQNQTLDQVKFLLLEELDKVRKGDFNEDLIRAVAANSRYDLLEGLNKNNNRVESLNREYIRNAGLQWDQKVAFFSEQSLVTKKEIMVVAQKYLGSGYVVLYKLKGEDTSIRKVEKPIISPVETNVGKQSAFVKTIEEMPVPAAKPQFIDFNKSFAVSHVDGCESVYLQNKENDLFHLYFRFGMGLWNNKYLDIATQYLEFLSTPSHSSAEITRAFYDIACNYTITVRDEVVTIKISGLNENMERALALFEELLNQCKPDEQALIMLKDRITKSRADVKLNKRQIMQGLMSYAQFGENNPFNYDLSTEELSKVSAQDLVHVLHKLETFRHMIIYYGPMTTANCSSLITRLHPTPKTFTDYPAKAKFPYSVQDKPTVLFTNYDMVQSEIFWVRNTGPYQMSQEPVIHIFNNYFGEGMGAVVFQTLRESKALAYSTYASYRIPDKSDKQFRQMAYIGCQADKIKEAVAGMNELLNKLPLSENSFSLAKSYSKKEIETQRYPDDEIIFAWITDRDKGWDHDRRVDEYAALPGLSLQDLNKFHQANIANKPYTYCVVGSDHKISQDYLKTIGTLKVLTLEQIFGY